MTRLNLFGAFFTIAVLCFMLVYVLWRLALMQREVLDCYKEQLRDAVTVKSVD